MRNTFLLLMWLTSCASLFAQRTSRELALTKGNVYLYEAPELGSKVVDSLINKDFFLMTGCEDTAWCIAEIQKGQRGYIPVSKMTLFRDLSAFHQRQLVLGIIEIHAMNGMKSEEAFKSKDPVLIQKAFKDASDFEDDKFSPLLIAIPAYFKGNKDGSMLIKLMQCIWINNGSANETPADALGMCYVVDPDLFMTQLRTFSDKPKAKEYLLSMTEFGLRNNYEADNGKAARVNFQKLLKRLKLEVK